MSGTGKRRATWSRWRWPAAAAGALAVAVDGHGNLVISDYDNDRIQVVAEAIGTFYGVAMTTGDIYTVAGGRNTAGFAGDGGPATSARIDGPSAVAVDSSGNLLISDQDNGRIREITG